MSSLAGISLALLVAACGDVSSPAGDNPALTPSLAKGGGGGSISIRRVSVSPSSVTVDPGATAQLVATAYDGKGNVVPGATFTWSSSATAVATVNGSGLVTGVAAGSTTIRATAGGKVGSATATVTAPPPPAGEVLIAAGDIAQCGSSNDEATAAVVDTIPGTVAVLGDNVYESGTATEYTNCYDPSWGQFKDRTKPSVGNHEYYTAGATGYYGYFGASAGDPTKGYYSYDLGDWHVVVLNSNCSTVGCSSVSNQVAWLVADLAATTKSCVLAYWHHPRFNSGASHGNNTNVAPFWDALYAAGAEVILNGHEHLYERFAPQTPAAVADPATGIRQFTVGTGGRAFYSIGTMKANSEVINNNTYGVLRMTLSAGSYSWKFLPVAGRTFTDAGTGTCH